MAQCHAPQRDETACLHVQGLLTNAEANLFMWTFAQVCRVTGSTSVHLPAPLLSSAAATSSAVSRRNVYMMQQGHCLTASKQKDHL